jgi:cobaltochelatase CobN
VTGFEIIPVACSAAPASMSRCRVSGFFRDAFPDQIALFDSAVRAVGALDEPKATTRSPRGCARGGAAGEKARTETAARRAGYRVFGSKPGAYGAGLQALIDERIWNGRADLAEAYLVWGGYAYGAQARGQRPARAVRGPGSRARCEAVVQNQDNREHDLLDSDDYYQFEGGMRRRWKPEGREAARSITTTIPGPSARSSARWRTRSAGWCAPAWSIRNGSPA